MARPSIFLFSTFRNRPSFYVIASPPSIRLSIFPTHSPAARQPSAKASPGHTRRQRSSIRLRQPWPPFLCKSCRPDCGLCVALCRRFFARSLSMASAHLCKCSIDSPVKASSRRRIRSRGRPATRRNDFRPPGQIVFDQPRGLVASAEFHVVFLR